jgi:carbon-monoxide dehydrogenase small subunit
MNLIVNGRSHTTTAGPLMTLLYVLREELGLTGAKAGCQHGSCGACTVLVDGEPRRSCLALVGTLDGASITTVEALGEPSHLIKRKGGPVERDEVVEALGGHYCRCTGYVKILDAVVAASRGERLGHMAPPTLEVRGVEP